jgi:hypothetical protein
MSQRNISLSELDDLQIFAADKFGYIDDHEKWFEAISDFVQTDIDGGRFVVYNGRNQFLADFDVLDEAIYYMEENEPKNEMFSIECEILN